MKPERPRVPDRRRVEAWIGGLLAVQPTPTGAAPANYPLSIAGAREYLADHYIFPPEVSIFHPSKLSTARGGGVFAAAFQNDGACFYLRMSAGTDSLWLAPVDAQITSCTGKAALAASGRYGIDAATEG